MSPWPGYLVAIGREIVYDALAAKAFSAGMNVQPSYKYRLSRIRPPSTITIQLACLPGHIQMSSIVDRWHYGILGGQLEINPLVWQLCGPNAQQRAGHKYLCSRGAGFYMQSYSKIQIEPCR